MLPNIPGEIQERVAFHPVIVVHQFRPVRCVRIEIQESGKLRLDAGHIVCKRLFVQQVSFLGFHGRIPYHASGPSHKCERLVPAVLEVFKNHYTYKVPDMQ